jgi:hypothetical protein
MPTPPVALIIFRRPEVTGRVLTAIAKARPKKLFVVADGPRPDHPSDAEACAATRAVIDRVDWDCEVLTNYSEVNLGCGLRPASGISWVFEHVSEAIILEDDCVPDPTFFTFCGELLEKYQDDERVMHITGSKFVRSDLEMPFSYYFSCLNACWGWATWRRAWQHFDMAVKLWPMLRETTWIADIIGEAAVEHWRREFDVAFQANGKVPFWDHQWTFACWAQSGLSIVPARNLISNLGCGAEATHTFDQSDARARLPLGKMELPLRHPPNVLRHTQLDRELFRQLLPPSPNPSPRTLHQRVRQAVSPLVPQAVKRGLRRLKS